MRTYPAYGRTIAALCARGVKPAAIGVLLSDRWGYFQNVPRVCIRPDEWKRAHWEFGFLRNMHVVAIFGDGVERVQFAELLVELMAAGPRLIWACMAGGEWFLKGDVDPAQVQSYAIESLRGPVLDWQTDGWTGPTYRDSLPARAAYQAGQRRAIELDMRIMQRIQDKGGDLVKWDMEERAQLAFVETMFGDPYAVPDDVAA